MAYYPFEPSQGNVYKLTNGAVSSVFNDLTDPNYVGMLKEITGLDSPDVRESAEELVQADGGQHGDFYFGRRPITMTGLILNPSSRLDRATRYDRLSRSVKALRSDATLSWKPVGARENLVVNPSFETGTTGWTGAAGIFLGGTSTLTQASDALGVGTKSLQVVTPATINAGTSLSTLVTLTAGVTYAVSIRLRRTSGANLSVRVGQTFGGGTEFTVVTGAAPASGAFTTYTATITPTVTGLHTIYVRTEAATATTFFVDGVMISAGTNTTYFDGDTSGFYWQGTPGSSASGDFIEMYTPVRMQQPLRETGAWQKEFQIALVSEYAPLFSVAQSTLTGASAGAAVTAENRGSWFSYPILRLSAASTVNNPTITNSTQSPAGVLKTTGLALAAGETIEFDTLNHTASFTAGARSGQSANRYIDFAGTTVWPCLLTGNNTYTPSGGTLTVVWRDTWA